MRIRNIRLTIEYDGTRYHGWQYPKKEDSATVSEKIREVLRRMTEGEVKLFCGEKTDPGVHALQQIVNFKTSSQMPEKEIRLYLNRYLPLDIAVRDVTEVSERFHAELNPRVITYQYHMLVGDTEDVFRRRYVDFRTDMPDIGQMRKGAERIRGCHDFKAFSVGKTKKSTVREVMDCRLFQTEDCNIGYKDIYIIISANGFLRQMPQKIIGTLLDIGYGKREYANIESILEGCGAASADCANHALFLKEVRYKE